MEELPEDNASPTIVKPIPLKQRKRISGPTTPVKTFLGKDPSLLPPTPSPKKPGSAAVRPSTPAGPKTEVKLPRKPAKEVSRPIILATQGGATGGKIAKPARTFRPVSPAKQPITRVKEFHFASDARSRRKTSTTVGGPEWDGKTKGEEVSIMGTEGVEMGANGDEHEADDALATRMRAHEIGKASILAWGETRGRYLDD